MRNQRTSIHHRTQKTKRMKDEPLSSSLSGRAENIMVYLSLFSIQGNSKAPRTQRRNAVGNVTTRLVRSRESGDDARTPMNRYPNGKLRQSPLLLLSKEGYSHRPV